MTTTTHRVIAIGGGLLLILALSAAVAEAQTSGAPTTGASYVPPSDSISGQAMLDQVMRANREQIRIGRTAAASSNADVRRYGQRMVDEHTASLNAAIALSDRLGYTRGDTVTTLSSTMTPADSGMGGGLSAMASVEADRAYLTASTSSNESLLTVLTQRGAKTSDASVRAMALQLQATIRQQIADGKKLQAAPAGTAGQ